MEAPHEEVVGGSYNELSHIVKGKRTKRLRPQSPIPFTITSHSSTRGDSHDQDGVVLHGEVTIINNNNNDNNSSPPPATSAENFPDVPTEEEEETAKCLILLSQGSHHQRLMESSPDNLFNLFNDDMGLSQSKFNSKKYVETTNVGNGGGKVGTYVYECKTCNRTFPSFQALGGHRASHKKPKPLTLEPKKPFFYFSDQDEPSPPTTYKNNNNNVNNKLSPLSPLSFQFNNINMESPTNKSSPRIHTCSYCGAEFNSGQALGGHMRRHRGGANTNLCLSPLSTPAISIEDSSYNNLKKPRNLGLSLDLNLPAPEDQSQSRNLQHPPKFPVLALEQQDDQGEKQKQQQQQHEEQSTALVLSTTPQLIDCHY